CIAVDPWFIVDSAPKESRLIRTAREVNDSKPGFVIDQVVAAAKDLQNPLIACFGLAFKANIADLRESPAVEIVAQLAERNIGRIVAVEPNIQELPKKLAENIELFSVEAALEQADIIVLLVDHEAFNCAVNRLRLDVAVIDTRGFFQKK
ncbi:MAG: UDP binding domain-containing protein, partial [Hafnia sp.]